MCTRTFPVISVETIGHAFDQQYCQVSMQKKKKINYKNFY